MVKTGLKAGEECLLDWEQGAPGLRGGASRYHRFLRGGDRRWTFIYLFGINDQKLEEGEHEAGDLNDRTWHTYISRNFLGFCHKYSPATETNGGGGGGGGIRDRIANPARR